MEIFRTEKRQVREYEPIEVALQLTDKDMADKNITKKINVAQFEIYKMAQAELYKSGVISKSEFLKNLKGYKTREKEITKYMNLKLKS